MGRDSIPSSSCKIEEFFDFYRRYFLPIYADFVALTLIKPEQILIEESNMLSHIAQYYNYELDETKRQDNLNKAINHLQRATLDLHKLVWAETRSKLEPFVNQKWKRLAFNLPEQDVMTKYKKFITEGMKARQYEVKNIGVSIINAIEAYEKVNQIGYELLESLDLFKSSKLGRYTQLIHWKSFFAGILVNWIAMILSPNKVEKFFLKATQAIKSFLIKYIA